MQYSSLLWYCRKKDLVNRGGLGPGKEAAVVLFPLQDHQDTYARIGTKGTREKSGTGNGGFRVLVLFKLSLVT